MAALLSPKWRGELDYNHFMDSQCSFRNAKMEDIKIIFEIGKAFSQDSETE